MRNKGIITVLFVLISLFGIGVKKADAGLIYLLRLTNNTYVSSYHSDHYFADQYDGVASVRGRDRFFSQSHGNTRYPR